MTREEALEWFKDRKKMNLDDKCQQAEDMAIKALEAQKAGRWIHRTDDKSDGRECSECGYGSDGWEVPWMQWTPFCPMCGARMEVEE